MSINWETIKNKLCSFNNTITDCKYSDAVTVSMPRTFLLGNGDIAAISSGNKTQKEYLISKGDFWSCGDIKTNDVMGFNPHRVTPITIGSLKISNLTSSKEFHEKLDISTGVLETKYDDVKIECFCHAIENAVVISLMSEKDMSIDFSLNVKSDVSQYPSKAVKLNETNYIKRRTANFAKENPLSWTSEVALSAFSFNKNVSFIKSSDDSVLYNVSLKSGEKVWLIIAVGGGGKTYNNCDVLTKQSPEQDCDDIISQFNSKEKFTAEIENSINWWENYWSRSFINLSDFELEKYYYGSLYIMACCSRDNKLAPGIFGNFITTDNPKWNGDYHMNYNFIAPFYGMYAANRGDFAKPLAEPMISFTSQGKKNAKDDLNLISPKYIKGGIINKIYFKGRPDLQNGIDNAVLYPVALGPYGVATWTERGGYLTQMNDCAFTMMGVTAYYFYYLDKEYLCEIEELLRLNVNFFLAWREKENLGDGRYRYNLWSGAHENTFEMNSPLVLASIKNILKCLLDGHERGYILVDSKDIEVWKDFLNNIADYPIREYKYRKLFKSFKTDVVPLGEKGLNAIKDSATVSLEFIHPGEELDFTTNKELKKASINLIDLHKIMNKDIYRQINNLPKIFIHGIRAGYDPQKIVKEFKKLYKHDFCYNYSVKDQNDTHGIEKAGGIEFINSMLISSDSKTVKIFPNWLKNKNAEFYHLRARGAFVISSAYNSENQKVEFIKIISEKQSEINIISPFKNAIVQNTKGEIVVFKREITKSNEILISFKCILNEEYTIKELYSK